MTIADLGPAGVSHTTSPATGGAASAVSARAAIARLPPLEVPTT